MSAKKVTRKELLKAPDEFISFSEKAYLFILEHSKQFITGIIVVVVAVALLLAASWYQRHAAQQALSAYGDAVSMLSDRGNVTPADMLVAAQGLESFLERYPDSAPARYALLDLGALYSGLGQFDQSEAAYRKYLDGIRAYEASIKPLVLDSLANVSVREKKYDQAMSTWREALTLENNPLKEEAYWGLGRIHETQGRIKEARAMYEKIEKEFPTSGRLALVQTKLATLRE